MDLTRHLLRFQRLHPFLFGLFGTLVAFVLWAPLLPLWLFVAVAGQFHKPSLKGAICAIFAPFLMVTDFENFSRKVLKISLEPDPEVAGVLRIVREVLEDVERQTSAAFEQYNLSILVREQLERLGELERQNELGLLSINSKAFDNLRKQFAQHPRVESSLTETT